MPPPVPPLPLVVELFAALVAVTPVVAPAVTPVVDVAPSVELVAPVEVVSLSFVAGGEENKQAVSSPEAVRASDQVAAEGAYSLITKPWRLRSA